MSRGFRKSIPEFFIMLLFLALPSVRAQEHSKTFAFANKQYVITAEVATEHSFVVNFINMSEFVLVIQPSEFIYKSASGRFYIGQVYEKQMKDTKNEVQKYSASILLKEHSYTGVTILGSFHELNEIAELSFRVGAKRFYLEPVEKVIFEQLAAKVSELDLANPDSGVELARAGIGEMGAIKTADGSSEWDRDWQGLLTEDGANPPKIIERPAIESTPEARKSKTYGKVKLSGIISKSGEIQDLKVIKGLGRGLDQRAMDGVKNSWVFLPATKNGEVFETAVPLEIDFPAPAK